MGRDRAGGSWEASATLTSVRRNAVELPQVRVVARMPGGETAAADLGLLPLVVGTAADCDLVVRDPQVSRRHCELALTSDGVVLKDLGSKNGTTVQGLDVRDITLPLGIAAAIGDSQLTLEIAGPPSTVPLAASAHFGEAIGGTVVMRALFAKLAQAAKAPETILLVGESGTGKELLARGIHDRSPRREAPFVIVDCSAFSHSLIEAELFGHERGAFTGAVSARPGPFEQADGGTLFLDEIGELPLELQPKLLRVLEARQVKRVGSSEWRSVDVRVVAATHRELRSRIADGLFRQDLYYRLAVVEARIPPLRDRTDDIPMLVERILASQSPPKTLADLPPNAVEMLRAHSWPGNVRELRNTVTRLILFPNAGAEAFEPSLAAESPGQDMGGLVSLPLREARDVVVEQFERSYILAQLKRHPGNIVRAAEAMQISRQLLYRLMDRYGLRSRDGRKER